MTSERVRNNAIRADSLQVAPVAPVAATRSAFYARLTDLLIGPDPAEGFFREQRFLHPGLDFALDFPRGWKTENARAAVAAQSQRGDAVLVLETQGESGDPERAAQLFAQKSQLQLGRGTRERIGGFPAYRTRVELTAQQGPAIADLTWIAHPRATFRLLGISPSGNFGDYAGTFRDAARSFRSLARHEREGITELRLRVATAREGESLAALSRRSGNAWSLEETAVANHRPIERSLRGGEPVKIAVEVPYRR
jgi:predicted Zn-dependent protease